jgi:hypothetical protein
MDKEIAVLHQVNVCMLEILSLKEKIAALEAAVEKFTSYNNSRDAIFSEQQVRISRLESVTSSLNLTHHVRG